MHPHEGMAVGQQVTELSGHLQLKGLEGHKGRENAGDDCYRHTVFDEARAQTIERLFSLLLLF
jgi:hypothetical protein